MYHHSKPTSVGAYIQQGFTHPLVLHVALALRNTFSFIQPHHIAGAWGSSYSTPVNTTGGEIGSTVQDGIVLGNEQVGRTDTLHLPPLALICGHYSAPETHYQSDGRATGVFVLQAAVTSSLWLTPEAANLGDNAKASGGTSVWLRKPPASLDSAGSSSGDQQVWQLDMRAGDAECPMCRDRWICLGNFSRTRKSNPSSKNTLS